MAFRFRPLRYTFTFIGPALAFLAFQYGEAWAWGLPLFAFGLVPLLELIIPPDRYAISDEAEARTNLIYDLLLYLILPIQFGLLVLFLLTMKEDMSASEWLGRVFTMGILCGNYGINVAHELGHRKHAWERAMARALLLTSQYMHFYTEHNHGHHRHVATERDPASANYKEIVYVFWLRSVIGSYRSAWRIELERLRRVGTQPFSLKNQMLQALLLQVGLLLLISLLFPWHVLLAYGLSAVIGFLLLETVNYIEHYALKRARKENGNYHKVAEVHSWNSDHLLGRIFMFELSRHSDHHYKSSKKYQLLCSSGPQMPTGYPGMMLLSLLPPLFFRVMEEHLGALRDTREDLIIA